MRRFLFVAMLMGLLLFPATAFGKVRERPVYLALGDSVAFGIGAEVPAQSGYVALVSRHIKQLECIPGLSTCPAILTNVSVPGATSTSLIADQLPGVLALIAARNGDASEFNDVEVITVTIGGNDIFNPVIGACGGGVTPECEEVIATSFATYAANLGQILGSLRAVAGADTRIVMMTYYNPLGSCNLAPLEPLADIVLEGGGPLPIGLNGIIRQVAAATGVEVAETYGRLGDGDFVGGSDCLHPNSIGHRKVAHEFAKTLGLVKPPIGRK